MMKKFVCKTIVFLLPALLFLALSELSVRWLPNTYKYKDEWMWANGHRVRTLLLGNSHAYYSLVPSLIGDSIFNLANVSQRLEHDYYLLKRYEQACPHLKQVVLVADNSCLFDPPMENDEPARVAYYQIYMGYRAHPMLSKYGFELANIGYFCQKFRFYMQGESLSCDSLGWGNNHVAAHRNPDDFLPEHIREHLFVNWEYTLRNRSYMDSIASWCQQRKVQLVLLQTPVCKAYRHKASPWQLQLVRQMTDSCCQSFGAVAADFSSDSRFADDDFFDSDHLADGGARKFSAIFSDYLRSLSEKN